MKRVLVNTPYMVLVIKSDLAPAKSYSECCGSSNCMLELLTYKYNMNKMI